jgi:hypothetical protein
LGHYLIVNKENNQSETLSPYLHCLVFHYCQMLELHGNIHIFTTQPNEKLNDFCTQYYHRNTNKQNSDKQYLLQLVQKRNRIEFYNLDGDLEEFNDTSDSEDEDPSDHDEDLSLAQFIHNDVNMVEPKLELISNVETKTKQEPSFIPKSEDFLAIDENNLENETEFNDDKIK